jgi:hypothetical protein
MKINWISNYFLFAFATLPIFTGCKSTAPLGSTLTADLGTKYPCSMSYEEIERASGEPEFKNRMTSLAGLCEPKNTLSSSDDKFFFAKWGKASCMNLMVADGGYPLQCNYADLIENGILNIAEAMAISGYTEEHYQSLNRPQLVSIKPGQPNYQGYDVFDRVLQKAIEKLSKSPRYGHGKIAYRGDSFDSPGRLKENFRKIGTHFTNARWLSSSCVKEIAFGPVTVNALEGGAEAEIRSKNPGITAENLRKLLIQAISSNEQKIRSENTDLVFGPTFLELLKKEEIDNKPEKQTDPLSSIHNALSAAETNIIEKNTEIPRGEIDAVLTARDPSTIQHENKCQDIYFNENPSPPINPGEAFTGSIRITVLPPANGAPSKAIEIFGLSSRRSEAEVLFPPGTEFRVTKMRRRDETTDISPDSVGEIPSELDIEYEEISR